MARQFTLGKKERLKSRKSIEELFSAGKKFVLNPLRVLYLVSKEQTIPAISGDELQFGVGVSAKSFRKAVDRNRIKRLVKEAYRLQKPGLQEKVKNKKAKLRVFFIYTGSILPLYKDVYAKTGEALIKLEKMLDETT